jgi:ParB family chromosome partitioning protein
MSRRAGLGRGLGALLPQDTGDRRAATLQEIPTSAIRPNRFQPRTNFDEEGLAALAASIAEVGVLQPILVRPDAHTPGEYELIAGERRWRAARRAGLVTIPAIINPVDDLTSLEQAVVENLHRQDLNPLDEAAAYQQLLEDFHITQEDLARRLGKSRTAITNTLRLLQLPPTIHRLLTDGLLTAGHARALLGTPDRSFQEQLALRVVEEGLSVRATEEAVRAHSRVVLGVPEAPSTNPAVTEPSPTLESEDRPTPSVVPAIDDHLERSEPRADLSPLVPTPRPAAVLELEAILSDLLATKVTVQLARRHGQILIDFADLSDLERIFRAILAGSDPDAQSDGEDQGEVEG